jgi:hypothetical protein
MFGKVSEANLSIGEEGAPGQHRHLKRRSFQQEKESGPSLLMGSRRGALASGTAYTQLHLIANICGDVLPTRTNNLPLPHSQPT